MLISRLSWIVLTSPIKGLSYRANYAIKSVCMAVLSIHQRTRQTMGGKEFNVYKIRQYGDDCRIKDGIAPFGG